jgi:hypothetical protein
MRMMRLTLSHSMRMLEAGPANPGPAERASGPAFLRRDGPPQATRLRIFAVGIALAAGSALLPWSLPDRSSADSVSAGVVAALLVRLGCLLRFPAQADAIKLGTAMLSLVFVAVTAAHMLGSAEDAAHFPLEAAVLVPRGPVMLIMG